MKNKLLKEEWTYDEPKTGGQIRVKVNGYYHHGIYMGNGTVIQFGTGNTYDIDNQSEVVVNKTTLKDFLQNKPLEVRQYSRKQKALMRPTNEIITTAHSLLSTGGYNFLSNNCEHFSNYCVFGIKYSNQTDLLKAKISKMVNHD